MNEMLLGLLIDTVKIAVFLVVLMTWVAYTTFGERRFASFFQNRIGPNRAGPAGLLQPLADGFKFLFKEDFVPKFADHMLYRIAPVISFVPTIILIGVVPFGPDLVIGERVIPLQIADPNFGVLYFLAVASFGVFGVIMAGWASNNKYSIMGGMRAAAMMISYEVSLGLAVVGLLLVAGTTHMSSIVARQDGLGAWFIWQQPFGFLLFFIASMAETHRTPFDLPEAEQELIGGYHTEYGSMQLGLFQMGEFAHMIASCVLIAALYLGGWQFPLPGFVTGHPILYGLAGAAVMSAKVFVLVFIFIWVRWTIPRFRYDQLMRLGWKVLLPLALVNVLVTALIILF